MAAYEKEKKTSAKKTSQQPSKRRTASAGKHRKTGTAHKNIAKESIRKVPFAKAGNMLYPLPAVMVSCRDGKGKPNIITVAWTGTICSDPPMVSISVRKERYSYDIIRKSGEFTINLTTGKLARATDYCGVRSGRDVDKFAEMHLTAEPGISVHCPSIKESPVSIECKVEQVIELGSHDMFIAKVKKVIIDESLMDKKGKLCLDRADLLCYSHGEYFALGDKLGTFGYSVRKRNKR